MYIRMYDELKRSEGDNPTIGIVLCSDTDDDIARYSVMHGNEQLFASKYKLYLPTKEELKAEIEKIFVQNQDYKNLFITILSFGFKYGIPADSDLVFDVRFLPNPYYVEGLRAKTGNDREIQDYVLQFKEAHEFLDKLEDMINFLIPNYIAEGKNQLVISIGCTGGKHRSVTLANELYKRMADKKEYGLKIEHRDIGKDALRGK